MTEEEKNIVRMAHLAFEEVVNEVATDYAERHGFADGGSKLVDELLDAMQQCYEEILAGSEDWLLQSWRHKANIQ